MNKVIAIGDYSQATENAIRWLELYGCTKEWCKGVTLVELPENVKIDSSVYTSTYTISFESQDDSDETYLDLYINPDAQKSELTLNPDNKYKILEKWAKQQYPIDSENLVLRILTLDYHEKKDIWKSTIQISGIEEKPTITFSLEPDKIIKVTGIKTK